MIRYIHVFFILTLFSCNEKKPISNLQICWIGDANNNVINSLIEASVKFSFKLNVGCYYEPHPKWKLF